MYVLVEERIRALDTRNSVHVWNDTDLEQERSLSVLGSPNILGGQSRCEEFENRRQRHSEIVLFMQGQETWVLSCSWPSEKGPSEWGVCRNRSGSRRDDG